MPLLAEFVFRLAFGLAFAMAIVPPRQVTSGYVRNHMYVLLGLNVLATLVAFGDRESFPLWPPLAAAVACYFGAVMWLYERPRLGMSAIYSVAGLNLYGAWLSTRHLSDTSVNSSAFEVLDPMSGGSLLGSTLAAMFLGHWYLNTPTMELAPLRRLLKLMAGSLALRIAIAGLGLTMIAFQGDIGSINLPLVILRWLAGLIAVAAVIWMTWQTLKIPNTQSATGILYVGVILTFLGELLSQLLSDASPFLV